MVSGKLVAICVGTPTDYGVEGAEHPFNRAWRTSFFKTPVTGPRWLSTTSVDGDSQADTKAHGGPEKAVLAYGVEHYPLWSDEYPDLDLDHGAFAENLDIQGLTEANVCLGDTWQIGEAIIQINQARMPCWKISRRWRTHGMSRRVQETGRTGWYHRVLQEGELEAGMDVVLLERPYEAWTIERCNRVMHELKRDREQSAELAGIPELADSWKRVLSKRVETGENPNEETRLIGANQA